MLTRADTHKVAPLVPSSDKCADEQADDAEDVKEERDKDEREGHASHKEEAEQGERLDQRPADIEGVPDLTGRIATTGTERTVSKELNHDGGRAEVAGQGKPHDGGHSERSHEQVVECPSVSGNEA